jgi:ABC-type enterochelin transport system substrate-binding protein
MRAFKQARALDHWPRVAPEDTRKLDAIFGPEREAKAEQERVDREIERIARARRAKKRTTST